MGRTGSAETVLRTADVLSFNRQNEPGQLRKRKDKPKDIWFQVPMRIGRTRP